MHDGVDILADAVKVEVKVEVFGRFVLGRLNRSVKVHHLQIVARAFVKAHARRLDQNRIAAVQTHGQIAARIGLQAQVKTAFGYGDQGVFLVGDVRHGFLS